jgi:hypothetical protein
MVPSFNRREFVAFAGSAAASIATIYSVPAKLLGLSLAEPQISSSSVPLQWMRDGLVLGSNTIAPSFMRRRGSEETDYAEKWRADLSDETVRTLLGQGINLTILSFYKGSGLKTERPEIEILREFIEIAHRRGLRVGGYVGGSLLYETLEAEEPASKDWKQVDEFGNPIFYTPAQTFRYMACRNNPGYMEYMKEVLKLGVQDLHLDLIHFDQMMWWTAPASCHCVHCRQQFKEFLKNRYPAQRAVLRFGFENVELLDIPPFGGDTLRFAEVTNPLIQEWALFRAWSIAQRYKEFADYIHKLNPETAVQGNPTMNPDLNVGFLYGIDYGQLLEHGDMTFSEEDNQAVWTDDGRLVSQIRTYKICRTMGKSLWVWQAPIGGPKLETAVSSINWSSEIELGLSEALAYNDRNLGVVAGLDLGTNIVPEQAKPYIDFFHKRSKDLVNTKTVADVAVLRSFTSIAFNPAGSNVSTMLFEQSLIQAKIPFVIILDRHLADLSAYKVLVLADQDALSDVQVASIRDFVKSGGSVVATGRSSLMNEWRLVRPKLGLADVLGVDQPLDNGDENTPHRKEYGSGRAVYIPRIEPTVAPPPPLIAYSFPNHYWRLAKNHEDLIASVRWAARDRFSAEVKAPEWVTIELARQENGPLLLHLVNYKSKENVHDIQVSIRPPAKFRVKEAVLVTPEHVTGQTLSFKSDQGNASMVIHSMRVYALVRMNLEEI